MIRSGSAFVAEKGASTQQQQQQQQQRQRVPNPEEIAEAIRTALSDQGQQDHAPSAKNVHRSIERSHPEWKISEKRVAKLLKKILKEQREGGGGGDDDESTIASSSTPGGEKQQRRRRTKLQKAGNSLRKLIPLSKKSSPRRGSLSHGGRRSSGASATSSLPSTSGHGDRDKNAPDSAHDPDRKELGSAGVEQAPPLPPPPAPTTALPTIPASPAQSEAEEVGDAPALPREDENKDEDAEVAPPGSLDTNLLPPLSKSEEDDDEEEDGLAKPPEAAAAAWADTRVAVAKEAVTKITVGGAEDGARRGASPTDGMDKITLARSADGEEAEMAVSADDRIILARSADSKEADDRAPVAKAAAIAAIIEEGATAVMEEGAKAKIAEREDIYRDEENDLVEEGSDGTGGEGGGRGGLCEGAQCAIM